MANGEESGNETTTAEETVGQHSGGITRITPIIRPTSSIPWGPVVVPDRVDLLDAARAAVSDWEDAIPTRRSIQEELERLAADLAPEQEDMTHEEPSMGGMHISIDPGIQTDGIWWTSNRAEPVNGAYQYSPRGFSYEAKTKLEVMLDLMSCRPSPPKFHAVGLVMGMVLGAPAHFQFDKHGNYSLCQPLYIRIPFREFLSSATILELFKLPYCVEDKAGTVDLFSLEHCPIVNVVYDDPVQNDQAALASSIGLILASDVVLFRHQRTFHNERKVDFNI